MPEKVPAFLPGKGETTASQLPTSGRAKELISNLV